MTKKSKDLDGWSFRSLISKGPRPLHAGGQPLGARLPAWSPAAGRERHSEESTACAAAEDAVR